MRAQSREKVAVRVRENPPVGTCWEALDQSLPPTSSWPCCQAPSSAKLYLLFLQPWGMELRAVPKSLRRVFPALGEHGSVLRLSIGPWKSKGY